MADMATDVADSNSHSIQFVYKTLRFFTTTYIVILWLGPTAQRQEPRVIQCLLMGIVIIVTFFVPHVRALLMHITVAGINNCRGVTHYYPCFLDANVCCVGYSTIGEGEAGEKTPKELNSSSLLLVLPVFRPFGIPDLSLASVASPGDENVAELQCSVAEAAVSSRIVNSSPAPPPLVFVYHQRAGAIACRSIGWRVRRIRSSMRSPSPGTSIHDDPSVESLNLASHSLDVLSARLIIPLRGRRLKCLISPFRVHGHMSAFLATADLSPVKVENRRCPLLVPRLACVASAFLQPHSERKRERAVYASWRQSCGHSFSSLASQHTWTKSTVSPGNMQNNVAREATTFKTRHQAFFPPSCAVFGARDRIALWSSQFLSFAVFSYQSRHVDMHVDAHSSSPAYHSVLCNRFVEHIETHESSAITQMPIVILRRRSLTQLSTGIAKNLHWQAVCGGALAIWQVGRPEEQSDFARWDFPSRDFPHSPVCSSLHHQSRFLGALNNSCHTILPTSTSKTRANLIEMAAMFYFDEEHCEDGFGTPASNPTVFLEDATKSLKGQRDFAPPEGNLRAPLSTSSEDRATCNREDDSIAWRCTLERSLGSTDSGDSSDQGFISREKTSGIVGGRQFVIGDDEEDGEDSVVSVFDEDQLRKSDQTNGTTMPRKLFARSSSKFSFGSSDEEDEREQPAELVPLGMRQLKCTGSARRSDTRRTRNKSKMHFTDFYKLTDDHLGTGAYASVRTALSISSGKEYAVKLVDKKAHGHTRSRIMREVETFKLCKNHPNIVQLHEWFEDENTFYMVFEKMRGGPLLNHIQRKRFFTEQEASLVTKDIATALKYLHDRGIAHRDVKPENILCTDPDRVSPVKLCDLDLASKVVLSSKSKTRLSKVNSEPDLASPVGSAEFMAPEVVDTFVGDAFKYDKRCDMWSLGVILYIMLCGYPPFYGECDRDNCGWDQGESCPDCQDNLFARIQVGEFDFPEEEWCNVSQDAKDLICHLLVKNVRERYTADDVLRHSWVMHGAPDTVLQTPCNLFRNDSARDIHQMYEHFNVMNRFGAVRLSSNAERSSTDDTTSEERENILDSSGDYSENSDNVLSYHHASNGKAKEEQDMKATLHKPESGTHLQVNSNGSAASADGNGASPHPFHPNQQVNMAAPYNMNGLYFHPSPIGNHHNHYLTTPTPHHAMYKIQYGNTVAVGPMQVYTPTSDGVYMQSGEMMMPMLTPEYYQQHDGTVYYGIPVQHQPSLHVMQPQLQPHPGNHHAIINGASIVSNTGIGGNAMNYGQHGGRPSFHRNGIKNSIGGRQSQKLSQVGFETCQNAMARQDSKNEIHQTARETQVNV
uniref:Protein kinase domain-containing protein n=1 Tax=Steinernema glaseri TaxID=37863 RepID=A0A1I7ZWS2_9BILA